MATFSVFQIQITPRLPDTSLFEITIPFLIYSQLIKQQSVRAARRLSRIMIDYLSPFTTRIDKLIESTRITITCYVVIIVCSLAF